MGLLGLALAPAAAASSVMYVVRVSQGSSSEPEVDGGTVIHIASPFLSLFLLTSRPIYSHIIDR